MPELLAYIDPGSGSLLIQGAIASIVAGIVFFRGQIARIMPGRRNHDEPAESRPAQPTPSPSSSVDDAARGG
jgi:hypothetical protein